MVRRARERRRATEDLQDWMRRAVLAGTVWASGELAAPRAGGVAVGNTIGMIVVLKKVSTWKREKVTYGMRVTGEEEGGVK